MNVALSQKARDSCLFAQAVEAEQAQELGHEQAHEHGNEPAHDEGEKRPSDGRQIL
jgi:hypothetical protein